MATQRFETAATPDTITRSERAPASRQQKVTYSCAHKGCHHEEQAETAQPNRLRTCPECRHRLVPAHLLRRTG